MNVKNTVKVSSSALLLSFLLNAVAYAEPTPIHTWHTVSSKHGAWQATLQMLNQGGKFVTPSGTPLTTFTITPSNPQIYGFGFDQSDDFDVAYTLTLVDTSKSKQHFQSKACVYVITASGPAQPDIRASAFNGATCNYHVVHGRGENFEVA